MQSSRAKINLKLNFETFNQNHRIKRCREMFLSSLQTFTNILFFFSNNLLNNALDAKIISKF